LDRGANSLLVLHNGGGGVGLGQVRNIWVVSMSQASRVATRQLFVPGEVVETSRELYDETPLEVDKRGLGWERIQERGGGLKTHAHGGGPGRGRVVLASPKLRVLLPWGITGRSDKDHARRTELSGDLSKGVPTKQTTVDRLKRHPVIKHPRERGLCNA